MNGASWSTSRIAGAGAVVFALVFPTLVTWVYFDFLAQAAPALQQTAYGIGKTLQFAFPVVWVVAVQRCRPGFRRPGGRGIPAGLAFGAMVFVATLILYAAWLKPAEYFATAGEAIHLKVKGFRVDSFRPYVALGAFYCVCHSFLEEYYWRWFVFGQLRRLVRLKAAIFISAVGFMAHHVLILAFYFGWDSPATWLFSPAVAVGGAVWAWIYHQSGSLYAVWLSHLLVDAAVFTIGYDLVRPFFVG